MRIVQIGSYPLCPEIIRGGVEASVYGLSQELGKYNKVDVFDIPRRGVAGFVGNEGNVTVHRKGNKGKWQVNAIRQVKTIAKEIALLRPDVCHIHGTSLFAWLMYKRLNKAGLSCLVTVHGLVLVEKKNALKKEFSVKKMFQYLYQGWVEKRFLGQLSSVVVDTAYVRDMIGSYPIRKKPDIYVIPQGINEEFYLIDCSPESRALLSVGAIGPRKGQLLTLRAFESLRDRGMDARLVMAGIVADQAYHKMLHAVISNSKYQDSVQLCLNLPNHELKKLYSEAHLFVLHSEEESQGIVFAEAMATGMPIVATRVGGIPFVVGHEQNGLLTDFGDVNAFADAICDLFSDNKKWQNMSNVSKQVAQKYHWSVIGNEITKLYRTLIDD